MLSTKIRATITAATVAAAVLAASAGTSSAATLMRRPSTTATPTIRIVQPTKIVAREVGSAGIEGYDDAKCESLEKDWETVANFSISSYSAGDKAAGEKYAEQANKVEKQLTENCLVVD